MKRIKDPVYIDKYALRNACLANETTIAECSVALGRASNYLAQNFRKGRAISMGDYENLKGMLKVTDDSLIKAIPVERAGGAENIYSPRPVKKSETYTFKLTDENAEFIGLLVLLGGGDKNDIVNGIVKHFRTNSALAQTINAAIDAVKSIQ